MRFILAGVSLVIALVLVGLGVAQKTVLGTPDSFTATARSTTSAPITVISGTTLNALDGRQDLTLSGSGTIFAAYARTSDVLAWVGEANYNTLTFDKKSRTLVSSGQKGAEATVPSPVGSDLWLREFSGTSKLDLKVSLDKGLSIIIASDGTAPAPSTVSITWPLDNRTPFALPLVAAGAFFALLALIFLGWALIHHRRLRGPRRKSLSAAKPQRMPRLPRQRSYRPVKSKPVSIPRGRRSTRRFVALLPVLIVSAVLLSGCSAASTPGATTTPAAPSPLVSSGASADSPATASRNAPAPSGSSTAGPSDGATPGASATVAPAVELSPPVATEHQIESIVAQVSDVATKSDAALDATTLATRFTGPALALRSSDYQIRSKDSAYVTTVRGIPATTVKVSLPQQSTTWPRTVFAVVQKADDTSVAPVALTMVQNSPREQYKVAYAVDLAAKAVLPTLAPEGVGAPQLSPDTKILALAPSVLVPDYLDLLNNGSASPTFPLFDIAKDTLLPTSGLDARNERKSTFPANATLELSNAAGEAETIALATNESGAIVSVYITETETVKPAVAGDTLNPTGRVKTLSGLTGTTTGVTATYGDQLLFFIPKVGSAEKIVLLGFSTGLISAKEL